MKHLTKMMMVFAVLVGHAAYAETAGKPKVMIMGTFHFANPGLDAVKTDQMNVMLPQNQTYLEAFSKRVADYAPTHVLIECRPEDNAKYDELFRQYVAGDYSLPSNENYQIGFRLAKQAGLTGIICYDNREIEWKGGALYDYLPSHEPKLDAEKQALIAEITERITQDHKTKSLKELLLLNNEPSEDALNKFFYVMTNEAGAGTNFVGADAAASWWHRNFRMYAMIQKYAQPGTRVFALGGQGHTAIMKDLLALDQKRVDVDVRPYF